MRDIIRKIYCDRCGKCLDSASYRHSLTFVYHKNTAKEESLTNFLEEDRPIAGDLRDFCADCTKSFYEWMKAGKKE